MYLPFFVRENAKVTLPNARILSVLKYQKQLKHIYKKVVLSSWLYWAHVSAYASIRKILSPNE